MHVIVMCDLNFFENANNSFLGDYLQSIFLIQAETHRGPVLTKHGDQMLLNKVPSVERKYDLVQAKFPIELLICGILPREWPLVL